MSSRGRRWAAIVDRVRTAAPARASELGQAIVETVLIVPLLLALTLVVIDGSQLLLEDIGLTSSARAAVAAAVGDLSRGLSQAQALADAQAAALAEGTPIACGTGNTCVQLSTTVSRWSGTTLEVAQVEDTVHLVFPDVAPITITASAAAARSSGP